jgi:cupin fold WbuC family metalloprotein
MLSADRSLREHSLAIVNSSVFQATESFSILSQTHINFLKSAAHSSELRRSRILLHNSISAPCQQMVILLLRGSKIRVHAHALSTESIICLSGRMIYRTYTESGQISSSIELLSGQNPVVTSFPGVYHSIESLTEHSIFFECSDGPFEADNIKYIN